MNLPGWLTKFIFPAEGKCRPEFVLGHAPGAARMALSGTTTYTDMYYFEDTVAEVTKQAARGCWGSVIGFPAGITSPPQATACRDRAVFQTVRQHPLIVPAVAPHAIYTVPNDVLQAARG
jgi:5-methylthioadenosine/S-adenosylhomocysteine deaminase